MKIRNVRHKGLRRLIENDDSSGVPAAVTTKLRKMVGFLQSMEQEVELHLVPSWNAHQMSGDRIATWSLSVTRNWRLTFLVDQRDIEIIDLDYEDYH
jgi:proteic killer suppression protein